MLDKVLIFSRCGIVLWSKTFCKIIENPIEEFISSFIIPEKTGSNSCIIGSYSLKWIIANTNGVDLIFVIVYSKLLTLLYLDELLKRMKNTFISKYQDHFEPLGAGFVYDFEEDFDRLAQQAETKHMQEKYMKNRGNNSKNNNQSESVELPKSNLPPENEELNQPSESPTRIIQNQNTNSEKNPQTSKKSQKRTKEDRVWTGGGGKISSKQAAALDRSNRNNANAEQLKEERELEQAKSIYLPSEGEKPLWEIDQEISSSLESSTNDQEQQPTNGIWKSLQNSYIGSMIQTITGGKILDENDLKPIIDEMKEMLQSKNVAQEIADNICSSVGQALIGHRLASFTGIRNVVLKALQDAVQRILTPGTSTDVLRQVLDAKAAGRVFTIVFVGVNGVGKSTSLAKIAYYLKQQQIKVMLAACDTFRSGAVEQLRTHAKCLDVPLFEMGYSTDPSNVAAAGITYAQQHSLDCVLIDTAGRMQNNEPLMKALAKLVSENSPDLVLFVGEALVGNDGIDQLSMFDRALKVYGSGRSNRGINGIVLTKFDTIDDKVGAALSMSYKSGQPVTFVGTGQKYTHLRKLNVNTVIQHLFET